MLVAQAAQAASYFLKENQEKKIEAVYRKLLMNKVNIVLIGMPLLVKLI